MVRFAQELLRPGAYRLPGGRSGRLRREDLAEVAKTTQLLMENGYEIPVLKKHAAKGAPHGGPRKSPVTTDHLDAQRVGRVAELRLDDEGVLHQILEIEDEAAAKELESGAARHTSAELRPAWRDEEGKEYGPIVAHVALTSSPRHTTQPPAELLHELLHGAVQFSLEEIEGFASEQEIAAVREKLDRARIPAGLRKRLGETLEARQYSAEVHEPSIALSEVLQILETALPPQWRQASAPLPAAHADGEAFFDGERLSDERAEQIARQQLSRIGLT